LDKQEIEEADKFTYLGSVMTGTGRTENEVKARIRKANSAFIQLYPSWRARYISIETKLKIFKSSVESVLLFARESWGKKKIKGFTDLHK
jgi:hypothetical protein